MENYAAKTVGELMNYVQSEVVPEIRRLINAAAKANGSKGIPNFSLHLTGEGYATYNVYTDEGYDKLQDHLVAFNPSGNRWKRERSAEDESWEAIRT